MSSTSVHIIELPEGYTSSRLVEHIFTTEELFDYLMVIHIVGSKETAPCILPCTLKVGPGTRTKSGRRRVTDAQDARPCLWASSRFRSGCTERLP